MAGKLKLAVLMGGTSAEREVSLSTGRQILNALDRERYDVYALDTLTGDRSLPVVNAGTLIAATGEAVTNLADLNQIDRSGRRGTGIPDVVFIALHGPGGEDGAVQGMLEVFGIPYTGSGVLASALAMDKAMSKRVLTCEGVLMPKDVVVTRRKPIEPQLKSVASLSHPVIVKPSRQGSTFGVTIAATPQDLAAAVDMAFRYDEVALVEQLIVGTEITVPIIGNDDLEVLPIVEIVPAKGFYDYEAKYTPGATDEIVPARLPDVISEQARDIARTCHRVLGCRGMSRTDMIVTAAGEIYTLEVNTIPGMTPTSLLPRSAEAAGISFSQLLDRLINLALER